MFDFDLSDELRILLVKLSKKDKTRAEILNKKIKEIISNDAASIDRYKNLRYDLKCQEFSTNVSLVARANQTISQKIPEHAQEPPGMTKPKYVIPPFFDWWFLTEYKRAHIDKSFVLLFKVNKEKNFIYFWRLEHHDKAYK